MAFDPSSLLDFYRSEHRIFGTCPHCNEPFRLSEVKLTYGKEPPRDVVSKLTRARDRAQAHAAELDAQIQEINSEWQRNLEDQDLEWRSKLAGEVDKRLNKATREIRKRAIAGSRRVTLGKLAEKLAPFVPGFGYDFSDVRPMFEPVDFIVFDGLAEKQVRQLVFIEFKTGGARLNPTQESIMDAVHERRVRFEIIRLSNDAVERMRRRPSGAGSLLEATEPRRPPGR